MSAERARTSTAAGSDCDHVAAPRSLHPPGQTAAVADCAVAPPAAAATPACGHSHSKADIVLSRGIVSSGSALQGDNLEKVQKLGARQACCRRTHPNGFTSGAIFCNRPLRRVGSTADASALRLCFTCDTSDSRQHSTGNWYVAVAEHSLMIRQ